MAKLLTGKEVADALNKETEEKTKALKAQGIVPALAVIRVGEKPEDETYEKAILKKAEKTGIDVDQYTLPQEASTDEVVETVKMLSSDRDIHGILVMRPLPLAIDDEKVCGALTAEKDVDGITEKSMAALYSGKKDFFAPCTAVACMEMLKYYGIDPAGKRSTVLGRSNVSGRPLAMLLIKADSTVTICHSKTRDTAEICRNSEIMVVAAGKAGMADSSFFNKNQVVLDVGINVSPGGKICGDVDTEAALPEVYAITPVPGGVGSVTVSVLMRHVAEATLSSCQSPDPRA